MGQDREKNPAAVALGKKRQAAMTDEEKRAFQKLGARHAAEANRRRTPEQHRAIARKAAATKRARKQISLARPAEGNIQPQDPASQPTPAAAADFADLERMIDEMPDELVARLAAALAGRGTV